MDDCPELLLKQLCCTCLSQDRKLMQLCRLKEGINNLYFLLSYDSEAYREGFNKDTVNWYICWECWAVMTRISRFRSQACAAQKQLSDIVDGKTDLKLLDICLTRLAIAHKTSYDETVYSDSDLADNFIDCGPDIKAESDDDIPLSELHNTSFVDDRHSEEDTGSQERTTNVQPVYKKGKKNSNSKKKKKSSKCSSKSDSDKKFFTMTEMSEEEMRESRDKRKMAAVYAEALYKCESCIEWLKNKIDLGKHILEFHTEKPGHNQCEICLSYIKTAALAGHRTAHYTKYACAFCDAIAYSGCEILRHLKSGHSIKNVDIPGFKTKGERKTPQVLNPGSKPRRNAAMMDKRTPFGYQCTECDKYFDNKNQRWKHVQQKHREGYKLVMEINAIFH
ncbi:hypothetical protein ABMA28_017218 [Loxostege sticticalis]|uniref:C2H2-type domain-containing protein n=1 Tax=Loxostege sticticalis TaxID=481309 RepID=A0ABD0S388_LOXSC